jgi:hypothetical protein
MTKSERRQVDTARKRHPRGPLVVMRADGSTLYQRGIKEARPSDMVLVVQLGVTGDPAIEEIETGSR